MTSSNRWIRAALIGVFSLAGVAQVATAQSLSERLTISPFALDSGPRDNPEAQPVVVFSQVVTVPGAPWLRLAFDETKLGEGSSIRITSFDDGETQVLDGPALAMWQRTTAYFNGSSVQVDLIAGPGSTGNLISMTRLVSGAQPAVLTERRVCDAADTRIGSNDARVARLLPIPLPLPTCTGGVPCEVSAGFCTGFIIDTPLADDANNRLMLTAGHCLEASQGAGNVNGGGVLCSVAQFEVVPATNTLTCALRHPPIAKQFPILAGRTRNSTPGGCSGNDWGVFVCGVNSNGQTVFQEQGQAFELAAAGPVNGAAVTKIGYGADGPLSQRFCGCVPGTPESATNATQQISFGTVTAAVGVDNLVKHNAHTCGGDSGCPLIDANGKIMAVHTGGGCNPQPSAPMNCGTVITNPNLVQGMAAVAASAVPRNDNCASALTVLEGVTPFSTVGATTDGPREAAILGFGSDRIDKDIWFKYTMTVTAAVPPPAVPQPVNVLVSVCGASFDTRLAVYSAACPLNPHTAIAVSDDNIACGLPGNSSAVVVPMVAGTTYYIRIGGYNNETGFGNLNIGVNEDCTVMNMLFNDGPGPTRVFNGPNLVSTRAYTTTTTTAARDGVCGIGAAANIRNDAWFAYRVAIPGRYRFDTCASATFDTCLAVYALDTGVAGPAGPPYCRVLGAVQGANEDGCDGATITSRLDITFATARTVIIRLGSRNNESGDAILTVGLAPPANDECANAAAIAANTPTNFNNLTATDSLVPAPTCGPRRLDLWYRYMNGATAGTAYADTCPALTPDAFDTTIAVYNDDCNALAEIACNDDGPCTPRSLVTWNAAANTAYLIRVGSRLVNGGGPGVLTITPPVAAGPVNNNCASALWAAEGTQPFNTAGATAEDQDDVNCITISNKRIQRDVWFKYRSTRVGNLIVDACDASFDARLAGYFGTACPAGAVADACGDDDCGLLNRRPRMNMLVVGSAAMPSDFLIRLGSFYQTPVPAPADPAADANANAPTGNGTLTLRYIPNDSCITFLINGTPAGPGDNPFDNTGALSDGPSFPAGSPAGCTAGEDVHRELWFSYFALATGTTRFSVCGGFDNALAVYDGVVAPPPPAMPTVAALCGMLGNPLACDRTNAAVACGKRSFVDVATTAGKEYYIRVGGSAIDKFGPGVLTITPPGTVPDNNDCFNATQVFLGETPYTTVGATTDGTTADVACLTAGSNKKIGKDVWFVHTAIATGTLIIDTCGSTFDNRISVHLVPTAPGSTLCPVVTPEIACGDDDCGSPPRQAIVRVNVTQGRRYMIRLGGYGVGAAPAEADYATGTGTLRLSMLESDRCEDAKPIFLGSTAFDSTGANTDGLAHANCAYGPSNQIDADLWYVFTAPAAGRLVVDTRGSVFDTKLALYDHPAACPPAAAPVCNDDVDPPTLRWSRVAKDLAAGAAVFIRVGGYQGANGKGVLNLSFVTNDTCATAQVVGNGSFPFQTTGATQDGTATCGNSDTTPDVWFKWTASCAGDLVAHTCDADYDTVVSVYTGGCAALADAACNDDAVEGPCVAFLGRQSYVRTPVTAGTMYWIRVSGYNGATGLGRLELSCENTGACCNGATCMVTRPSECTGAHKRFAGSGVACNAPGNDVAPCCKADFSQNAMQSVQDVFDFLSAWFAGDLGADADGNGVLSVLDIFAFITQWFNGCP